MSDDKLTPPETTNAGALPPAAPSPPSRRRYGRRRGDISDVPPWLISFTDIMALMLTFFVLLYAMSEPEEKSWSEVVAALQKEFHVYYGPRLEAGPNDTVDLARVNFNRALPLDYLNSLLEQQLDDVAAEQFSLYILDDRLVISLPDVSLFDAGSAQMKESAARQLFKLGGALSRIRNRIEVVGHSDPSPITKQDSAFPSNWELSLERAGSVGQVLKKSGYTQPIMIFGNSSIHFSDLNTKTSEGRRDVVSRRVDIHIMPDDGRRTLEKRLKLE